MKIKTCLLLSVLILFSSLSLTAESVPSKVKKAIKALHAGENVEKNVQIILASEVSGNYLFKALKKPRKYSRTEKKGLRIGEVKLEDDYSLKFAYQIPSKYSPKKPLPLVFMLHGGVTRPQPIDTGNLFSSVSGSYSPMISKTKEPFILVTPQGSDKCTWWNENGRKMILTALKKIRRKYYVDTNRIFVTGFSDGGSGSFFCSAVDPSYFAATFPMNGMLSNVGASKYRVILQNFRNRPIFVCNTTKDSLYPPERTQPFADAIKEAGADLYFKMIPNIGHRFTYAQMISDDYSKWLKTKKRNPWGEKVEWATSDPALMGRCDWLKIVELGMNTTPCEFKNITAKIEGRPFFSNSGSGYAKVTRQGNVFTVEANNVKKLSIALSPAVIDFKKPVVVIENGKEIFNEVVKFDRDSVVHSYVQDEDPNTLVAKYLEIEIP